MYCKNCGNELNSNALFCPNCGLNIKQGTLEKEEKIQDNTIKFQLKPRFSMSYKFLSSLGRALLGLLIICYFINLPMLWTLAPGTFFITLLIIALYIIIKMIVDKKQYENLEFNFYCTKVEYKDGFLNKEEKEVKYKYIREVVMRQNILERICNLGTIMLYTNASSGMAGSGSHSNITKKNGIYIHCVKNVQEQYKKIKDIIETGSSFCE